MPGLADRYLGAATAAEKYLYLVDLSRSDLDALSVELRDLIDAGQPIGDQEFAFAMEAATRRDVVEAAAHVGLLGIVFDGALELTIASRIDPLSNPAFRGLVASGHPLITGDAGVLWRQARLGAALCERDLDRVALLRAHDLATEALRLMEDDGWPDPHQSPDALRTASTVEEMLWRSTRETHRLDKAVSYSRRAVAVTRVDAPELPRNLATLSQHLAEHFRQQGDPDSARQAVTLARRAVSLTPEESPDLLDRLATLVQGLAVAFEAGGDLAELEEAIGHARRIVELSLDAAALSDHLHNLGYCLALRFEATGEPADIDEAVRHARLAIHDAEESVEFPTNLTNLASHLAKRFASGGGEAGDLDEAVDCARVSVDLTSRTSPDFSSRLSNLAAHLVLRFEVGGMRSDLDDAILRGDDAVMVTPFTNRWRSAVVSNQAGCLCRRFLIDRANSDWDAAIVLAEEGVERAPDDPNCLSTLASCVVALSSGGLDLDGIERAIKLARHAFTVAAARSATSPDLAQHLSNLSGYLEMLFRKTGNRSDLDEAIALARQAVDRLPETHPAFATSLNNLARHIATRLGTEPDDEITYLADDEVTEADDDEITSLDDLFRPSETLDDGITELAEVLERWADACERGVAGRFEVTVTGPLWVRQLMPLAMFGPLAVRKLVARIGAAVLAGAERLSSLPENVGPETRRTHALEIRKTVDGVAAMAAYAHLLAYGNDALGALSVLESGLTTVAVEQAGGPLWKRARASEPELVDRLAGIARRLRVARSQGRNSEELWAEHGAVHAELEHQVGRLSIRRTPEELSSTARSVGVPLMWIAATPHGGFLIVLRPEGQCFHVLLPELTTDKVIKWHAGLHPEQRPGGLSQGRTLRAAVDQGSGAPSREELESVLDELTATLGSIESWWGDDAWVVPVGLLATMPWQARWPKLRLHTSGALHSIAYGHALNAAPAAAAALLDTRLGGADEDGLALKGHLGAEVLCDGKASRVGLAELPELGVLHFAVHGTTEPALLLADCDLRPEDIGSYYCQFSRLRLLFANACFSGSLSEDNLDEALGFATAAAVAGTSSILAALWPLRDATAGNFAHHFYGHFKHHGDPHKAFSCAREATTAYDADDASVSAYQLYGH